MNIAFRVDASKKIGTGHFERCLTLANRLNPFCSKIIFVCRHLFDHLKNTLRKKGYQFVILNSPENRNSISTNSYSNWLGVCQKQDAHEFREVLSENYWDWIIVDHYALDYRWESLLKDFTKKILVIDDLANRNHDCDLLLDQNYFENKKKRYIKKIPRHCKMLLGPKYSLLREEFLEIRSKIIPRSGNIERILVFFGGVDINNYTLQIMNILKNLNHTKFSVDVIVSSNNPHKKKIISNCKKFGFISHYQTKKMAELLAKADLSIGAGGTVTWERICCLLPTIVITTAENQILSIKELSKIGAVLYIGHFSKVMEKKLHNSISEIILGNCIDKFTLNNNIIKVDGLGSKRVASFILNKKLY